MDDIVCTRLFCDDGVMAFDVPRSELTRLHAELRETTSIMEPDGRDAYISERILMAMSVLDAKIDDERVFGECAAAIFDLVARQPAFHEQTCSYLIGVELDGSMRFNAFGSQEKNQFDFHCDNLKRIFAERGGRAFHPDLSETQL